MDLKQMEAEVKAYCIEKGWYDDDVPFHQAMALLHEEVSEAGHAWRDHGLEDATSETPWYDDENKPVLPKPEGVPSEFADVLIRLLDDSGRYKMDIAEYRSSYDGAFAIDDSFMVNIDALHNQICRASVALDTPYMSPSVELAGVLVFLEQLCDHYGIDLMAEYTRKMAYNKTRAYRHGGRRA